MGITGLNCPLGGERFLTTEYTRDRYGAAPRMVMRTNETIRTETDAFGDSFEVPTRQVRSTIADAGRKANVDPVRQDFLVVQTEERRAASAPSMRSRRPR